MGNAILVLGNQLFAPSYYQKLASKQVFMAEDYELCTHFKYHKHKIIFFLAAMRAFADELQENGYEVHYEELDPDTIDSSYEDKLRAFLQSEKVSELNCFEIEDKFFEKRLVALCKELEIELVTHQSPMFMFSRASFKAYVSESNKPFMKNFYEAKRKETGILMKSGKPIEGKYSFDSDNRRKLPQGHTTPQVRPMLANDYVTSVVQLVHELFDEHPGDGTDFWLPTTRSEAKDWEETFFLKRFEHFGPYEDAISSESDFVYHSALSPLLNIGLVSPTALVNRAVKEYERGAAPINSVEGFVRQVMGWREFVRGIYQEFSEEQDTTNFFGHSRTLKKCWYDGTCGVPPLDDAIKKANRLGYNHHIERLMIISNVMLMTEIAPEEVHRWFMEMYVDSSDWVMGPNVYGMAQFSDGGIFATKPYTCGSNYILKMSDDKRGAWCDIMDGLYWRFIEKNIEFYKSNPRMGAVVGNLDRMKKERKQKIFSAAEDFIERVSSTD